MRMKKMSAAAIVVLLLPIGAATAESNIDPASAFAWGESIGWVNLYADGTNGVVVTQDYLHGFAWSESVGWIWFGGIPDDAVQYSQAAGDTGVNNDGEGNLSGYAWGANIGWINFDTSSVAGPEGQVTIDMTSGQFSGFAWSESVGWINFGHDYGVSFVPETSVGDWMLFAD